MNIKKKIIVLTASVIMAFSVSPLALAATPEPTTAAVQTTEAAPSATVSAQTANVSNAVNTTNTMEFTNKKYLTKGAAAVWFILLVIVNAAISFWIGNRFYRLSKKDNHISADIRALRKDIEEKFVKSVGGFTEQETDIENLNESLALDDEGIKTPERQPVYREVSAEEEERFRRWEEAQAKPKRERVRPKSAVREELNEDLDDVRKIRRKNYQPERARKNDDFDTEENEDLGETKEIKLKGESVKSKAKEILGDIFPFKED